MNNNFAFAFQEALKRYKSNDWEGNWDFRRFGPFLPVSPSATSNLGFRAELKEKIKTLLAFLGLYQRKTLVSLIVKEQGLQWLYERLSDAESGKILIDVMAYRVLGHRKVKLPLNTPEYWDKLKALEGRANTGDFIDLGFLGWRADRYDLKDEGYPIQVYARAPGVFTQLLLQQYRCITPDHVIEVEAGDTVIDAGGCYGDTALYFAHKAGEKGRVFSFEFMPDNIRIFTRNLELNPGLANQIEIISNPLWSSSGQRLYVEGIGPAAHITPSPKASDAKQVETLKIDDLVENRQLARVDFIKMDIEGAELEALKGAAETIRRYRPKLAISVYHRLPDFWEIPQWIDGLGAGYRFHLRHFTIHTEETVLFAESIR
ncbi:FkbM family methyltransferase [Ferrigenium sp. UT5]|uniref:FkbM family methyltransferase n=1 Tax=Ferrigenium sp. UT5 TaxID=3242105 RepID=UPI00354EF489